MRDSEKGEFMKSGIVKGPLRFSYALCTSESVKQASVAILLWIPISFDWPVTRARFWYITSSLCRSFLFLSATLSYFYCFHLIFFTLFPSIFPFPFFLFNLCPMPESASLFSSSHCLFHSSRTSAQHYQTRKWPSLLIKAGVSHLFPCRGEACAFTNSLFPFLTSSHPPWAL